MREISTSKYFLNRDAYKKQQDEKMILGLQCFLNEWDSFLTSSVESIVLDLSGADSEKILNIRSEAKKLYLYCRSFFLYNPKEYTGKYFQDELMRLVNEHYNIIISYYSQNDLIINPMDLLNEFSRAQFILSTNQLFKEQLNNLANYVENGIRYSKTQIDYNLFQKEENTFANGNRLVPEEMIAMLHKKFNGKLWQFDSLVSLINFFDFNNTSSSKVKILDRTLFYYLLHKIFDHYKPENTSKEKFYNDFFNRYDLRYSTFKDKKNPVVVGEKIIIKNDICKLFN